jgi:hypothetical protein
MGRSGFFILVCGHGHIYTPQIADKRLMHRLPPIHITRFLEASIPSLDPSCNPIATQSH